MIGHKDPTNQHNVQPLKHLMYECDEKARKTSEQTDRFDRITSMKFYGNYTTKYKGIIMSRLIQETM